MLIDRLSQTTSSIKVALGVIWPWKVDNAGSWFIDTVDKVSAKGRKLGKTRENLSLFRTTLTHLAPPTHFDFLQRCHEMELFWQQLPIRCPKTISCPTFCSLFYFRHREGKVLFGKADTHTHICQQIKPSTQKQCSQLHSI